MGAGLGSCCGPSPEHGEPTQMAARSGADSLHTAVPTQANLVALDLTQLAVFFYGMGCAPKAGATEDQYLSTARAPA